METSCRENSRPISRLSSIEDKRFLLEAIVSDA
jgi:hypothetical protein